jgi:hypothetical protein
LLVRISHPSGVWKNAGNGRSDSQWPGECERAAASSIFRRASSAPSSNPSAAMWRPKLRSWRRDPPRQSLSCMANQKRCSTGSRKRTPLSGSLLPKRSRRRSRSCARLKGLGQRPDHPCQWWDDLAILGAAWFFEFPSSRRRRTRRVARVSTAGMTFSATTAARSGSDRGIQSLRSGLFPDRLGSFSCGNYLLK